MIYVISNPTAGKKGNRKNPEVVARVFEERGIEYELYQTTRKGEGKELAEKITGNGETDILVLGGDGTLHEVLNGLKDPSKCRLGLIPSGTGNDFAETLGIPMDAMKALQPVLENRSRDVDYMTVGGKRCMNVCGVGMDVDVLERCNKGKSKGKLKYFRSLLSSLFAFKGYPITVETMNGTETHDALLAAVCNGKTFGGGIKICPIAEADDEKLELMIVENPRGKMKIVKAFLALMKGKAMEMS